MDPAYCIAHLPLSARIREAIDLIKSAYEADADPWIVGFSGGKDSSCVLKLLFHALRAVETYHKPITVLYCDTGVEIPQAASLARGTLAAFRSESARFGLPISTRVVSPPLKDSFFVKILGRGYPTPSDKFRWCTDRLRIGPVTAFLKKSGLADRVVVIGVRESESASRALTLKKYQGQGRYWRRQGSATNRRLFVPILDFALIDVWQSLLMLPTPRSVMGKEVAELYAQASGECPTIREPNGAPCGKARFGCWTCTVAKNGTTLRSLVEAGNAQLRPLLDYRLWLDRYRHNPRYRWKKRRNCKPGLGPMTMRWRRMALEKLLSTLRKSGLKLITDDEIHAIKSSWRQE